MTPFALGAAQCFAAYFVAHGARGWYWSMAALCVIGFLGYINAEVNAKLNPTENVRIMVFYGKHLCMLLVSSFFLAILCGTIAHATGWSDETLAWLSLPLIIEYTIGEEVLWIRLAGCGKPWSEWVRIPHFRRHAPTPLYADGARPSGKRALNTANGH